MPAPLSFSDGRVRAMADALSQLARPDQLAVSVPFFSPADIDRLMKYCLRLPMRTASPRVGAEGKKVIQDFDISFPAPREKALAELADMLEQVVAAANAQREQPYLDTPLLLNDLAVQHYHPNSKGIGPHCDALRYRGLVFIITLAGVSRLATCDDREGNGAVKIDDSPGNLTILSAPGFCKREGELSRPLHFVDEVTKGRLSIGLRHDSKV